MQSKRLRLSLRGIAADDAEMGLPRRFPWVYPDAAARRPAVPVANTRLGQRAQAEEGFTIIEVIVATLVLVLGLLTSFLALNVAVHSSSDVRARQAAVTLARQITEDARSIPYAQIASSTIATALQAEPGLANSSSSGSTWTIVRDGFTYTVTPTVTDLNDPKDTSGNTDIKQVAIKLSWATYQNQSHSLTETATMSAAGEDPGLAASGLALYTPASGYSGSSTAPVITSSSITSLQFVVTAPTGTDAIVWTLDGQKESSWDGSTPNNGTWYSSAWSLSGVSDGTYTVGAAAEDANGVVGPAVTISVRLIRNVPSAPVVTGYGFNANLMANGSPTTAAEFQWNSNPELNIVGYRIYNPSGTEICQTSNSTSNSTCGANAYCVSATQCIDLSPPSTGAPNRTYKIKALYYDANNVLQEGTATSVTLASGVPSPPPPPASLTVTKNLDGSATLSWPVSSGGTAVNFYRVYRDGDDYRDRYDSVSASSCTTVCTYTDTNRTTGHSYYVTAVGGTSLGSDMAESQATGPVGG
jgi:Tfp pilus assembly protein PilV